MSSGLQLDVRHYIQWRRHLVNAYEVKAGMVLFADKKLCDPCLSALEWFVPSRRYTSALIYLYLYLLHVHMSRPVASFGPITITLFAQINHQKF